MLVSYKITNDNKYLLRILFAATESQSMIKEIQNLLKKERFFSLLIIFHIDISTKYNYTNIDDK